MKKLFLVVALTTATLAVSGTSLAHFEGVPETKSYDVIYSNDKPVIDGFLNEDIWSKVPAVTSFVNPWGGVNPPTSFKAYHDQKYLYFAFQVTDPQVITHEVIFHEMQIPREDRVELFFAPGNLAANISGNYPHYYALEIDKNGRALSVERTIEKGGYFNLGWEMQSLNARGQYNKDGYVVEGQIALSELNSLGVINHNEIRAGIYRAEFSVNGKEQANWITWVNPNTPKPDFHNNMSFGEFVLLPDSEAANK